MIDLILHSKPSFGIGEKNAAIKVIESGQLSQGKIVLEFEKLLSKKIGSKKSSAVSSGTAALHLALVSMGVGKGSEVLMPSWVCSAPLNAVLYCNATPVLADIGLDFNISIDSVKKKLSGKTKAIIVPHMFGLPAELNEFQKFGIPVIEDCAHSIGSAYYGKKVGGLADLSVFSFYSTKMLSAGEGGAISGKNRELVEKCLDLRDYTHKPADKLRFNYKWTNLQAAIALEQLKNLESFVIARQKIAKNYLSAFSGMEIGLPEIFPHKTHVFYRFIARLKNPESFIAKMSLRKIFCGKGVFEPLHDVLKISSKNFPNTAKASKECVSIPIYPALSIAEQETVIEAVKSVLKAGYG